MSDKPHKSDDVVIAQVPKNARETIFVTNGAYNGHDYVGMRIWVNGKDGEPIPTQKGINLAPEKVPDLIAALEQALTAAKSKAAA